jgi:hypothetical protein
MPKQSTGTAGTTGVIQDADWVRPEPDPKPDDARDKDTAPDIDDEFEIVSEITRP